MNTLQKYALMKAQIKDLQESCKLLEESILEEVKEKGGIKENYCVFSVPVRKSYTYSKSLQKEIEEIEKRKKVEEIMGKAKVTISEYLRFTPVKMETNISFTSAMTA